MEQVFHPDQQYDLDNNFQGIKILGLTWNHKDYLNFTMPLGSKLTKNFCWRWTNATANPADLTTRGVSPDENGSNSVWWHGLDLIYQEIVESSSEPDLSPDKRVLTGI
ncbi:hypothetical protein TNCT_92831 [Trichonephila clavata]|uniref:Uncharacterized protein n=1 Tax=Trichonephila clavata TaxID=2740835 RepID=A0A8X6L4J8_TRICU|nr:hypothetical protein TNCT_92831 [Trichonephila clavata]